MSNSTAGFTIVNWNDDKTSVIDVIEDYATFIDVNKGDDSSISLVEVARQLRESYTANDGFSDCQEYFFTFAECANLVMKMPSESFEGISNLLLYILKVAPDLDALVPVVLSSFTNDVKLNPATSICMVSVLGKLFNLLDSATVNKFYVFDAIFRCAVVSKTSSQFVPQLPQIAKWLHSWPVSDDNKVELVNKLVEQFDNDYRSEVTEFLKLISNQNGSTWVAPFAEMLVRNTLTEPHNFEFDSITKLPAVQGLEQSNKELFTALSATANGQYSLLADAKLDAKKDAAIIKKCRATTLSRMASEKNLLTYEEIKTELNISVEEVERYILIAIKGGILQGRISQLNETFAVEGSTVFGPMKDQHWDCIEHKLNSWKRALLAVSEANSQAEENGKLVKLLSRVEVQLLKKM